MAKKNDIIDKIIRDSISDKILEFSYKHGKGNFKIYMGYLIGSTQTDFRKVLSMIDTSDTPNTIAGYINSALRDVYNVGCEVYKNMFEDDIRRDGVEKFVFGKIVKLHDILASKYEVKPLVEAPVSSIPTENTFQSDVNISRLKRCNVTRFIPTQVKPVWEHGRLETHIGYNFEYRGLNLQVFRVDGWEYTTSTPCKIFVIDPVIGLPITSYDGMLSELEDKLSQVFIGYLKTLESNKEAIVQLANAFKNLKADMEVA